MCPPPRACGWADGDKGTSGWLNAAAPGGEKSHGLKLGGRSGGGKQEPPDIFLSVPVLLHRSNQASRQC